MKVIEAHAQQRPRTAHIAIASLVGTAIEFYDFYIYGTAAALVIGPVFFPVASPSAQALNAFLTFGIAFLARPLGSALFGHFGDRVGRKATLVASLLVMGISTTLIGVLPGYAGNPVRAPLRSGNRPWRRVGRRGAAGHRKRAGRPQGVVRHVSAARTIDRLFVRQRPISPAALGAVR